MLYLVLKHDEKSGKDVGINSDGSIATSYDDTELLSKREAEEIAKQIGGCIISEKDMFPEDWE